MNKWAMMYGGSSGRYDEGGDEREMRRRRDERGRYMEADDRPGMYGANNRYDTFDRQSRSEGGREMRGEQLIGFKREEATIGPDGRYNDRREGMVIPMNMHGGQKQLTREEARKWMREMKHTAFEEEEAMRYARKMGLDDEEIFPSYWAVINALVTDYEDVARKHGVHKPEFYADLAKAWICDEDAVENKAAMYYRYVVEHE